MVRGCGLNAAGSTKHPVTGQREHSKELTDSLKAANLLTS